MDVMKYYNYFLKEYVPAEVGLSGFIAFTADVLKKFFHKRYCDENKVSILKRIFHEMWIYVISYKRH